MSDPTTKRTGRTGASDAKPSWFLLFGGRHEESIGGLRSIRGVFASEDEARSAFRRLRLEHRSAPGWGELIALDRSGRVRELCWFGAPSEAVAAHPAGSGRFTEDPATATAEAGVSEKSRFRRRSSRASSSGPPEDVRAAWSR